MDYDKYRRSVDPVDHDTDSDSSSDSDTELPITHQFCFPSKAITSLKYTTSGDYLLSGTIENRLDIYDFSQMALNSLEPRSNPYHHNIHTLDVNALILPLTSDSKFELLELNGSVRKEFPSGDRYLYDVMNTKGHTDSITDGEIHEKVITSSLDSTIRLWDINKGKQDSVLSIKQMGKKLKVSKVTKMDKTVLTVDDVGLKTWDYNKLKRPIDAIHEDIVDIAHHSGTILLRSRDALRLYDKRNLARPMIQRLGVSYYQKSPMLFNDHILLTTPTGAGSVLQILDKSDLMTVEAISSSSLITSVDWNDRTNQISYGDSNGINILFDLSKSHHGILNTIQNKRKRHFDDGITANVKVQGYNMDELRALQKSKKKKNDSED
jgi:hypothetical protein